MCLFKKNIDVPETVSILHELIHEEETLNEANKRLNNELAYLRGEKRVTHLKILLSALRCSGIAHPS